MTVELRSVDLRRRRDEDRRERHAPVDLTATREWGLNQSLTTND